MSTRSYAVQLVFPFLFFRHVFIRFAYKSCFSSSSVYPHVCLWLDLEFMNQHACMVGKEKNLLIEKSRCISWRAIHSNRNYCLAIQKQWEAHTFSGFNFTYTGRPLCVLSADEITSSRGWSFPIRGEPIREPYDPIKLLPNLISFRAAPGSDLSKCLSTLSDFQQNKQVVGVMYRETGLSFMRQLEVGK